MAMKVLPPNEGIRAVVRGTSTAGLAVGSFDCQPYLALGWSAQRRIEVIDENTEIRFEWLKPPRSFYNVRVGSSPPDIDTKTLQPSR